MDDTLERVLELHLVLVVHSDADGHGRVSLTLPTPPSDVRKEAVGELDMAGLAVVPEAGASHFGIELTAG